MARDDTKALPPSQRIVKEAADEKKRKEHNERQMQMLREDFGKTFSTDHGKRVLAWLALHCGWAETPISATFDDRGRPSIDLHATLHKAQEQSVYLMVRRFVPKDILKQIEYGEVNPSGHIEKE